MFKYIYLGWEGLFCVLIDNLLLAFLSCSSSPRSLILLWVLCVLWSRQSWQRSYNSLTCFWILQKFDCFINGLGALHFLQISTFYMHRHMWCYSHIKEITLFLPVSFRTPIFYKNIKSVYFDTHLFEFIQKSSAPGLGQLTKQSNLSKVVTQLTSRHPFQSQPFCDYAVLIFLHHEPISKLVNRRAP